MQGVYEEHNEKARSGESGDNPFLIVDLCNPGEPTHASFPSRSERESGTGCR